MNQLETLNLLLSRPVGTPLQRLLRDLDPAARVILARSLVAEYGEGDDGYTAEPRCYVCNQLFQPSTLLLSRDWNEGNVVSYRVAVIVYSGSSVDFVSEEPEIPCCDRCWHDVEKELKK